jgi:hypothetical protein
MNVTLDLNGHKLTVDRHLVAFNGSNVVDNSAENTGLLALAEGVSKDFVILPTNNTQLPVYTGEGYMFVSILKFQQKTTWQQDGKPKYVFLPTFEPIAHDRLAKGVAQSRVTVAIRLSWTANGIDSTADYVYSDALVANVINSYGLQKPGVYKEVFSAVINNSGLAASNICAVLISDTGVEIVLTENFG